MKKFLRFFQHFSLFQVLVAVFVLFILGASLRGIKGNPTADSFNEEKWKDEGPFELSPERGRFALTYSLLEDRSYQFSKQVAAFAAPDIAKSNGQFVSLFAPTISYLIMPGYMLGKSLEVAQLGTYAIISLFAIANVILLQRIAMKFRVNVYAATAGALLFLFASPAYAYAVSLYQHHVSTFLILLSLFVLLKSTRWWSLVIVWFCCALSISVDNPNLFMMFPIGVFALGRVFWLQKTKVVYRLQLRLVGILTMFVMTLPVGFFLYFNTMSYGNPLQLAGTVASTDDFKVAEKQDLVQITSEVRASNSATLAPEKKQKNVASFFTPRRLPHGLYEHFLSLDRGMIIYTPVLLIGFFGLYLLGKSKPAYMRLILAIMGMNILLYSMWGDPYGGWAFGSRYLIPTYALLALLLALVFDRLKRNILLLLIILVLGVYCVGVNTIGALTSNRNPPLAEILHLESLTGKRERYTFTRNMEFLDQNRTKTFVFQETAVRQYLTAWQYTAVVMSIIITVIAVVVLKLYLSRNQTSV